MEVHDLFNHCLNDGHLFPILVIIGNASLNNIEAEFLGERICAFVIHIEISNLLFSPGMHHRFLLFLHYRQFGVSSCTFHLAQILYLAKMCVLAQRDRCDLQSWFPSNSCKD